MATTDARTRPRPPLTRERVLGEALRLVDEDGLEALTMRRLGKRLGIEAMSLYHHVDGKAGLRAGIVDLMWEEVERSVEEGDDWKHALRSLATRLRALAADHPHAFPLLMGASSFAEPMLRALSRGLAVLREAGFDDDRSARTLNTVVGYACGYAAMELSFLATGVTATRGADQLDSLVELARALPPDTAPELVRVARDCCLCDMDQQFEFGLDALLAGLDPGCETL
ncbi:MAG: TetR/AcrR family transcriptional regulator [Solirubrobacteraceae bacterium]